MSRIIVHAGFHKTGTTSLQTHLALNRAALAPWLRIHGKEDFPQASAAARRYGQRRFAWRLWDYRLKLRRFLRDLPDPGPDGRPAHLLTRETLSGPMPGHRDALGRTIRAYRRAALPLARATALELRRRFGPQAQILFFYTIRNREDWLNSVHGHLLRSIRLREDANSFRRRLRACPDLQDEVRTIGRALAPLGIEVHSAALERWAGTRCGLSTPLLRLAGVPEEVIASLAPAGHENRGHGDALRRELLALNRSQRDKAALRKAKQAAIRGEGRREA